MGINILLLLLLVGMAGLFRFRMRYDRILSWGMFLASILLVYGYSVNALLGANEGFQYLWSKTKFGNLFISFYPQLQFNMIIVPILCMGVVSILNNNVFHYEERRCAFNSLLIFNSVALSLLLTSENYVQILTMVFISDILGYVLLKDVDSSHKYAVYNFFADMCLFAVFALVCGRLQSLDVRHLLNYNQIGRHKDFVSLVVGLAIFIKIGVFPFHSYLLDVAKARFHRMTIINLLFSPLCGIILLVKLNNILTMSDLFLPIYTTLTYLSAVIGLYGFIVKDNILSKTIYLNMVLSSILMMLLKNTGFAWQNMFSYYYLIVYFLNLMLFKIYLYQNREESVANMLNSSIINSWPLKAILVQIALIVNLFVTLMFNLAQKENNYVLFYVSLLVVGISIVLSHIYKSPNERRLDYLNQNKLRAISYIGNSIILILSSIYFKAYQMYNIYFVVAFVLLINLPIFYKTRTVYNKTVLQAEDYSRYVFYYLFFRPIKYISKKLWVMVDFVISEKIITSAIETINRQSITLFFKLNPKKGFAGLFFIVVGIAIFIIQFIRMRG